VGLRYAFRVVLLAIQELHDIGAGSAVVGTDGGGGPNIGELAGVRRLELIGVEDVAIALTS
jgi:DUF917 family protein